MGSLDIDLIFTNILLEETIKIYLNKSIKTATLFMVFKKVNLKTFYL